MEKISGRIDLDRQPSFREVDLNVVGAFLQAAANLRFVLVQQVLDKLLAGLTRNLGGWIQET